MSSALIFTIIKQSHVLLRNPRVCFNQTTMEIKLIVCFSCVIPTINFQRLKILLVTLLFFIVEYIFLKQFVKLLMVKYTYLLTFEKIIEIRENCRQITITFVTLNRFFSVKQTPSSPFVTDNIKMDGIIIQTSLHCGTSTKKCNQAITQATL